MRIDLHAWGLSTWYPALVGVQALALVVATGLVVVAVARRSASVAITAGSLALGGGVLGGMIDVVALGVGLFYQMLRSTTHDEGGPEWDAFLVACVHGLVVASLVVALGVLALCAGILGRRSRPTRPGPGAGHPVAAPQAPPVSPPAGEALRHRPPGTPGAFVDPYRRDPGPPST